LTSSELSLQDCKEQAVWTVFKLMGYGRKVAKRKGFLDDPAVIAEQLAFAKERIQ
jgi:hypothetical protein